MNFCFKNVAVSEDAFLISMSAKANNFLYVYLCVCVDVHFFIVMNFIVLDKVFFLHHFS